MNGLVTFEENDIVMEVPDFGVVASGADHLSLLSDVASQLEELADEYVNLPDEKLTPSGIALREKLRSLVLA